MYISVSLSCAAEINTCKPTILQKFKKKILIIKKKKKTKKKQTLANYNRYSTQEHSILSSQNMDQPVRRGANRRRDLRAAHRLAASLGRPKP